MKRIERGLVSTWVSHLIRRKDKREGGFKRLAPIANYTFPHEIPRRVSSAVLPEVIEEPADSFLIIVAFLTFNDDLESATLIIVRSISNK